MRRSLLSRVGLLDCRMGISSKCDDAHPSIFRSEIQFAMPEDSEDSIAEALARLERDVANLKNALVQLGAKPCSVCAKFYRDANGNLFTACGDSVCYTCLPGWWVNC